MDDLRQKVRARDNELAKKDEAIIRLKQELIDQQQEAYKIRDKGSTRRKNRDGTQTRGEKDDKPTAHGIEPEKRKREYFW